MLCSYNYTIHQVLNIIHAKSEYLDTALLSEKAFDRMEHYYLHEVLSHFDFGKYFSTWIKVLYNKLVASVATNNIIAKSLNLAKGTRQGCPLTPLLCVLGIELLAIAVRSHQNFTSI